MNKTINAKRNIIWGLMNQIIALGFPFLIRTIIIQTLGSEYLGLNSLFTSIIQVLNLTELGFSSAIIYSLYRPIANENDKEICSILNYFRHIYRIIGIVILSVGVVLTPFLPYLINGNPPSEINIYVLFILYLINTSASYLLFSYEECIILAHQRNDLTSKRNIFIKTMLSFFQIGVLLLTQNYYLYVLIMPITTVLNNIIIHILVKKHFPQYTAKGDVGKQIKGKIKEQVAGLMIIKIAALTRNSFDNIIISAFIGLALVGIYGNYYYIMSSLQVVLLIFLNSIQAAIGNNVAVKDKEKNFDDFSNFSFIYAWLSGWTATCLVVFYQPFMKFWVGEDNMLSITMVALIGVYYYLLTMGDVPNVYIDATGIWWKYKTKAVIESISNLIMNVLFVKTLGIYGVVLATIFTRLIFGIIWGNRILFNSYFGSEKAKKYYSQQFLYFVLTCTSVIFIKAINVLLGLPENEFNVIMFLECICIPNIVFVLCYSKTDRFRYMLNLAKRIVGR